MHNVLKIVAMSFLSVLLCVSLPVGAIETDIDATPFQPSESQEHISRLDVQPMAEYNGSYSINCFDVNDNEEIAIGFDNSLFQGIAVYDKNGTYLYGYKFDFSGSFFLEWSENGLDIISVRSDIIATYDENADCKSVLRINDSNQTSEYYQQVISKDSIDKNGNRYELINDLPVFNFFVNGHTKLQRTAGDGTKIIIYDSSTEAFYRVIITLSLCIVVLIIAVFAIARTIGRATK